MFPHRTAIDWLRFRTQADPRSGMEAVGALYGDLGGLVHLGRYGRGMHGFRDSAGLFLGDLQLGRVDYGGEHQRGWSRWEITGRGCEFVSDWAAVEGLEALEAARCGGSIWR